MDTYVYKTTNKVNGRFYIGVHTSSEADDEYLGSGKLLKQAINKYGRQSFEKTIIAKFKNKKKAYELESLIVDKNLTANRKCYNLTEGGNMPPTFSGDDHPNIKFTSKDRDNICRLYKAGNTTTKIAKKYNTSRPSICYVLEVCGVERVHKYDFPKGEDHKNWIEKDTESIVRRYQNGESTTQIADSLDLSDVTVGRILRDEGVKMRVTKDYLSTPVIQIDLCGKEIRRFNSASEAERQTGVGKGNIRRACGKPTRTAGGFKWSEVKDD